MNDDLAAAYSAKDIALSIEMHRTATREKAAGWRKWPGQSTDPIEQEIAYRVYKEISPTRRPDGEWNDEITEFTPTEAEIAGESHLQGTWQTLKPGRTTNHIWRLVLRGLQGLPVPEDIATACTKALHWREAMLVQEVEKIAQAERLLHSQAVKAAAEAEQRAYLKSADYKRAKANEEIARCEAKLKKLLALTKRWSKKLKAAKRTHKRLEQK